MDWTTLLGIAGVVGVVVFLTWWREYRRLAKQRQESGDISHLAQPGALPEDATVARDAWKSASQQVGTVNTKMRSGLQLLRSAIVVVFGGILAPLFLFVALTSNDSPVKNRAIMGGIGLGLGLAVWYFARVAVESWREIRK